jgi:hypothetical protein
MGGVKRNPSRDIIQHQENDGLRFAAPILRKLIEQAITAEPPSLFYFLISCLQIKFAKSLLIDPGTSSNHLVGFSFIAESDSSLEPSSRMRIVAQFVSVFVYATVGCRMGGVKRNPSRNIIEHQENDGLRFAAPILSELKLAAKAGGFEP